MITYLIDNKLGGVSSLNYNLIANSPPQVSQQVIHIDEIESLFTKSSIQYPHASVREFVFSTKDNYYHTLKKLRNLIPDEPGALILNYGMEMAMLDHYPVRQTTFQLVHDDYNLKLAKKYGHVVDVFVCHNSFIYSSLLLLFPGRNSDIFYLPHGVPIPSFSKNAKGGTLKLLFLGRMTSGKGIFDLPEISFLLREKGVKFEWLCIGDGPELGKLKTMWHPEDVVTFISPATNEEVMTLCASCDVFVLPTKFEGSPVSLLETMSLGLVPVVSRIQGGITDIVNSEIGFTIEVDNNSGFANAIQYLDNNPAELNRLSINCRRLISEKFDVKQTSRKYHDLFSRYCEYYREKNLRRMKVGARLDQRFLPNWVTRSIRALFKK